MALEIKPPSRPALGAGHLRKRATQYTCIMYGYLGPCLPVCLFIYLFIYLPKSQFYQPEQLQAATI